MRNTARPRRRDDRGASPIFDHGAARLDVRQTLGLQLEQDQAAHGAFLLIKIAVLGDIISHNLPVFEPSEALTEFCISLIAERIIVSDNSPRIESLTLTGLNDSYFFFWNVVINERTQNSILLRAYARLASIIYFWQRKIKPFWQRNWEDRCFYPTFYFIRRSVSAVDNQCFCFKSLFRCGILVDSASNNIGKVCPHLHFSIEFLPLNYISCCGSIFGERFCDTFHCSCGTSSFRDGFGRICFLGIGSIAKPFSLDKQSCCGIPQKVGKNGDHKGEKIWRLVNNFGEPALHPSKPSHTPEIISVILGSACIFIARALRHRRNGCDGR